MPRSYWVEKYYPGVKHWFFKLNDYTRQLYASLEYKPHQILQHDTSGSIHFETLLVSDNSYGTFRHSLQFGGSVHREAMQFL